MNYLIESKCEVCGRPIEVEQPVTVSGWYGGRLVVLENLRAITKHEFCPEHKDIFLESLGTT